MRQTVIGIDAAKYKKKTNIRIVICVLAVWLAAVLNLTFVMFRNDQNHTLFLILNIAIDIACIWFLIYFISLKIAPRVRFLKLHNAKKTKREGSVDHISDYTERVDGFDCFRVKMGERAFFVPRDGAIKLCEGQSIVFFTVGNIIVETK